MCVRERERERETEEEGERLENVIQRWSLLHLGRLHIDCSERLEKTG